ncbi:putative regulator of chromosome condensation 1/beta-lactamase-inhibitor protein II [Helianthus annuus]|nr:putative regulator of chromosome condensation 1/beta-lactamase-inhibitor protein II [Helianthus annuus]
MAISDTGKLITWGATDDLGQSYVTSGRHGETPEPFPLPNELSVVKAAAGWAHCVCVTVAGDVYTWGWKECVPFGTVVGDPYTDQDPETDLLDQDMGQVWGWGYGGEGQLGLGSRIRMASSPRPIPCIGTSPLRTIPGKYIRGIACGGRHSAVITDAGALVTFGWGLYGQVTILCFERVSYTTCFFMEYDMMICAYYSHMFLSSPELVIWWLHIRILKSLHVYYHRCWGIRIDGVAAGLWHTICISSDGAVYAFGGNQFGQLGTGTDHAETLPRLLDDPSLENEHARVVSCGARHSAIVTDEKVFCWGWNKYGQLGLGDVVDRNVPSQVELDGYVPRAVCVWLVAHTCSC